jgi:hypothetical protein
MREMGASQPAEETQSGGPAVSPVQQPQRYCVMDLSRFVFGDASELVFNGLNGSLQVLPSRLCELLNRCRSFKTLDEHAKVCCSNQNSRSDSAALTAVRNQLSELAISGLLVSEDELLSLCRQSKESRVRASSITSIGIVTRNRPRSLKRSVTSYIENCKRYGRRNGFVVMDDSEDPQVRAACRQVLLELKRRHGAHISYCSSEDKRRVAGRLADMGLPVDEVNFALFGLNEPGRSFGANRNALSLHTTGELVFSSDDDVSCEIAEAPGFDEVVEVFSAPWSSEPLAFWFFPDRQAAISSANFVEKDVLAIHEQLLGRDVADVLTDGRVPPHFNFDCVDGKFTRGLASRGAKVLVTMPGIVGDSGMNSPRWFLLTGDSRERVIRSESAYRSACISREILRVVRRSTISLGPMLMTTAFGFDNRDLQPPFFPAYGNEDGVFGMCLRKCFENGYIAHLPWALLHKPPEVRSFGKDDIWKHAGCRISDVLILCIASIELKDPEASAEQRMMTLGRLLMEIGSMTQPDFEEFLRLHLSRQLSVHSDTLEERLQTYEESPRFWADDIRKYLEVLRTSSQQSGFVTPIDLTQGRNPHEARVFAKRLVSRFGRLLCHWPAVVKAAQDLKARDQTLARPIS